MNEVISQTLNILTNASEILKSPAVSGVFTGFVGWLGSKLQKKSAIEKLEKIQDNDYGDEEISGLKATLEFILEDNDDLIKTLSEKVESIEKSIKKAGISINKTNQINIHGNSNISANDINNSSINISNGGN